MAREKIIEIKTGEAIKSVQDLKNNISAYKEKLKDLEIGTNEYQNTLKSLQENQAALRNAMHGTAASFTEVMNAATATNVVFDDNNKLVKAGTLSYNELVRELDILKQQWRATTNEAERLDLGRRINEVNNRLKDMDASVGVFGRNVGNYIGAVDHLTAGLASMGKGASGIVAPLKGVTAGFKTMSATPAVAILGLLANILSKVMDALKDTEEGTNGLTQALAPFQAIGDAIVKILQAAADVLVGVVGWVGKLTQAIIGNNEAAGKRLAIAKAQAELDKRERETLIQNAEAERDIAELRAKSTDRETYTARERLGFLEQAGKKEAEIAQRAMQDAKLHYQIVKARNSLAKSSKRDLEAEAQAYAALVNAETAYFKKIREINSGITSARNEEAKSARDAAKAVKDAAMAKINSEKEYLSALLSVTKDGSESQRKIQDAIALRDKQKSDADAQQKITDAKALQKALRLNEITYQVAIRKNQEEHNKKVLAAEVLALKNRAESAQKGSVEYATAMYEAARLERDKIFQELGESDAAYKARQLAAGRAALEAQQALNDAILKETTDGLQAQMAGMVQGSVEQLEIALQIEREKLAGMYQGIDETQEQFAARQIAARQAVGKAEDALMEGQLNHDRTILEQRMATLQEGSVEYLSLALELKQLELDKLHQLEGESNEAFRLRELQAEKEAADARRAIWEASINIMQQAAGGITSILGTIADAMESNTNMTKAEAEKAKNLRIAGATIDMFQGAVTAYSSAQQLGPIAGPIIGALNAAAVVATGIANINKIKAQQVSTTSSATQSPAIVQAPAVTPEVNQVRSITGASEEERLNQMASNKRVYILSSDLEADREATRVQVEQTTF